MPKTTATITAGQLTDTEFDGFAKKLLWKLVKKGEDDAFSKIKAATDEHGTRQMSFNGATISLKNEAGKQHITVEGVGDTLKELLQSLKELAESRVNKHEREVAQYEERHKLFLASTGPNPGAAPNPPKKIIFEIQEPNHLTDERLKVLLAEMGYDADLLKTVEIRVNPAKQKKGSGPVTVEEKENNGGVTVTECSTTAHPPWTTRNAVTVRESTAPTTPDPDASACVQLKK